MSSKAATAKKTETQEPEVAVGEAAGGPANTDAQPQKTAEKGAAETAAAPPSVDLATFQQNGNDFHAAQTKRNIWRVIVKQGTPFEALLQYGYWLHVATKLRPYDVVEAIAEDGSWASDLLVHVADNHGALMVVKIPPIHLQVEGQMPQHSGALRVEFAATRGWRVVRISDAVTLQENLPSELAAKQWAVMHERTMNR